MADQKSDAASLRADAAPLGASLCASLPSSCGDVRRGAQSSSASARGSAQSYVPLASLWLGPLWFGWKLLLVCDSATLAVSPPDLCSSSSSPPQPPSSARAAPPDVWR